MDILFSIVIPAWNEMERLPGYLDRIRAYLPSQFGAQYEVLVVDDGSQDGSPAWLEKMESEWPQFRCLLQPVNQGKGAAVRAGMLAARGQLRLFADADGAAPIQAEWRLRQAIEAGADVAVGSRFVAASDVHCRRGWSRAWVGWAFARVTHILFSLPVRDTQCGFKMFRGEVAAMLFGKLQETEFLFDLELLILAQQMDCRVAEVAIDWADVPGSRMSLWRELGRISMGMWRLRRWQRQCKLEQEPSV